MLSIDCVTLGLGWAFGLNINGGENLSWGSGGKCKQQKVEGVEGSAGAHLNAVVIDPGSKSSFSYAGWKIF